MTTLTTETLQDLRFHTPPEARGQAIECSYAYEPEAEVVVRRCYDRSDLTTRYQISHDAYAAEETDLINREPDVDDWESIEVRR